MQPYAPPAVTRGRPSAIAWFRVYALTMAVAYLAVSVVIVATPRLFVGVAVVSGTVGLAHAAAAFLPFRPWAWPAALVVLCIGLSTPALPVALLLLTQWTKPLVKAAFGRL